MGVLSPNFFFMVVNVMCLVRCREFLEVNLPAAKKGKKKKKFSLGVTAPNMGTAIQEGLGFSCHSDETTREIVRGVRLHLGRSVVFTEREFVSKK